MKQYYIASVSGGKDSLAMVLRLMEEKQPLDEIVFFDTGMEFNAIYDNIEKIFCFARVRGIKTTKLTMKDPFEYVMLHKTVNKGKENEHKGYSWCGGACRWGTNQKLKVLDKYCEDLNAYCYVGIAADEQKRIEKGRKPYKLLPLVVWGMTEKDCLSYCREKGFNWFEISYSKLKKVDLYEILDRVSCWCCANKNLKELRNMYKLLPQYWIRLKGLQSCTERPFKNGKTVFDLEERFNKGL